MFHNEDGLKENLISAVILAAGMSTRMGAVKQLMPFGGATLLEAVIGLVRRSSAGEIIVVLGAAAEEIRAKVSLDGVKVVMNEQYREGMGTSLRAGIAHVSGDAALVVLADQPFVESRTIDRLIQEYREKKPQIAIPVYRGFRGNPVLLDRSVFPEVMGLGGDVGCRAIFGGHSENILRIGVEDVGVLLDIDTPGDFEKPRGMESADLTGREADSRPQVVIVGSEKSGRTLATLAHLMKFGVTIIDPFLKIEDAVGADRVLHELDFSKIEGDPFVVIASGGRFDEEAVEQAAARGARYIALVANKKRAQEVLRRVEQRGIETRVVRTKAGVDIGAEGPEEIALSILAEIIAERHRSSR